MNPPDQNQDDVYWTPEGIIMLALTGLEGEPARRVREAVMEYVMGRGPRDAIWGVLNLPAPHRAQARIHADSVNPAGAEEQFHIQLETASGSTLYCIAAILSDPASEATKFPTLAELRTLASALLDVADRTPESLHATPLAPNLTQEVFIQQ